MKCTHSPIHVTYAFIYAHSFRFRSFHARQPHTEHRIHNENLSHKPSGIQRVHRANCGPNATNDRQQRSSSTILRTRPEPYDNRRRRSRRQTIELQRCFGFIHRLQSYTFCIIDLRRTASVL